MPLIKSTSKKAVSKNIKELNTSKPSSKRDKGIKTYAKNHNMSYEDAKHKMSIIIALNQK